MSIPARFMEIARSKLDRELYDSIYARAVELEREAIMKPNPLMVENPVAADRVASHLNSEQSKPPERAHAAAQIERRMEIDIGPEDLGDLLNLVRCQGPNVKVTSQAMDMIQHLEVNWRGKHFVVVYSKSRDRLITAYPKTKKRKGKKVHTGRPKDWRAAIAE